MSDLLLYRSTTIPIYKGEDPVPNEQDYKLAYWKFETREVWGLLYKEDPTIMRYLLDQDFKLNTQGKWYFHTGEKLYAKDEDLKEALMALNIWR